MRKPRSYAEVYNDLDREVVTLFKILRNEVNAVELQRRLNLTPFARDEFDMSYEPTDDQIEISRRLIIRSFMGFGADGHNMENGKTGFRANSNRSGTTPAHDWANWPENIKSFTKRLAGVVIENRDAFEVMEQQDSSEALHFVDPPYVHETRQTTKHAYKFEMDDEQHIRLCDFLKSLKGSVVLCGYSHKIYERLGWAHAKREAHADGARDRTEIIWLNQKAIDGQSQKSFQL